MKKLILSTTLFVLLNTSNIFAQKVVKTVSNEVCTCFKKESKTSKDAEDKIFQDCMVKSMIKNADAIKKETKIDILSGQESAGEKLGELIGVELVKSCPEFLAFAMKANEAKEDNEEEEAEEVVNMLDSSGFKVDPVKAKNIKTGKYKYTAYFMNNKQLPDDDTTSYFEFKDNATKYYDYSENGTKVYAYSVTWKSATVAELKLIEKKNMKDEQITKIGDKIIFTIKSTQTNEIYVQHVLSRLNMKVISKVVKM